MDDTTRLSHTLHDIKSMMERSSRFISLSGLSGIAAGICALTGAWFAYNIIYTNAAARQNFRSDIEFLAGGDISLQQLLSSPLFTIGMLTFIAAFISAFIFTWLRSRKTNVPIWGTMARRLLISVCIPMLAGAVFFIQASRKTIVWIYSAHLSYFLWTCPAQCQ